MLEKIGNRIKELRINKLKITQEEFAKILGVDRTYLSRVELGKKNLTLNTLIDICSKLDVSLNEFFDLLDKKENGTCD